MSNTPKSRYVDMPVDEIVKALCDHAQPGSKLLEEIKGALTAAVAKQLVDSIDRHERAASKLSFQLLWLNIILGAFTIAGTVLTIVSLMK